MKAFSFSSSFKGMKIWNEIIDCSSNRLTMVVPDYEESLLEGLVLALQSYFPLDKQVNETVIIVYSDCKVRETLYSCMREIEFEFIQLDEKDMNSLVSYMLLTSKHYGAMWKQSVRLISFNVLYGNQLKLIAGNGLYTPSYLILEKILYRI